MATTRETILAAATSEFEERGYANVTLRDIAKRAGISIGTLTYHFHQKTDLVAATFGDFNLDFFSQLDDMDEAPLFESLVRTFQIIESNHEKHGYFFRNLNEIVADSDTMSNENLRVQRLLIKKYAGLLRRMKEAGLLRDDVDENQIEAVSLAITSLGTMWRLPVMLGDMGGGRGLFDTLCSLTMPLIEPDRCAEFVAVKERFRDDLSATSQS